MTLLRCLLKIVSRRKGKKPILIARSFEEIKRNLIQVHFSVILSLHDQIHGTYYFLRMYLMFHSS